MSSPPFAVPPPIRKALQILDRQRWIARQVLGEDPPGCVHHPEEGKMEENIRRMIGAIKRAKAEWALIGAEALNLFVEPRATEDFDLVVFSGRFAYVLEEVRSEFGKPAEVDIGAAVRFPTLGIDLIRSDSHALFRIALERARAEGAFQVPPPEVMMALKFLSAISPWRKVADRKQDMVDFIRLYQTKAPVLDRVEMVRLGGLAYPGAEREFGALIDKLDRGEEVSI